MNGTTVSTLEPAAVWREFAAICQIPHPSGREAALRDRLAERGRAAGLTVRLDAAGNLRLDRAAAPGCEHLPKTLIQGHLDMVPQVETGTNFNFATDAVEPMVAGDWVRARQRTTLGADNGMGLAMGLALIFDRAWRGGALGVLATVEEETSMRGASHIDPALLECDRLLNLDSECDGELCCGCAGGVRLQLALPIAREAVPEDPELLGVRLSITGMKGGHSGMQIDEQRGNAVEFLWEFIDCSPEFRVGSFEGGTLANAIPRDSVAVGVVARRELASLQARAAAFAAAKREDFDVEDAFAVVVETVAKPARLWSPAAQRTVAKLVCETPSGVLERSSDPDAVLTSSNFATMRETSNGIESMALPRSFDDAARQRVVAETARLWIAAGGACVELDPYPGWKPEPNAPLAQYVRQVYCEYFDEEPVLTAIHAGLECGIFAGRRPGLAMISFGPTIEHAHSPSECVEIASVAKCFGFLQKILEK